MAGGKSNYLEDAVKNLVLGGTAFTAPATHVALYSASPTDASAGTELTGGAYARVTKTNNATNWPASTAGSTKSNGTTIDFPQATADWSRAYSWSIMDASTAGNMLYYGPLATSIFTAYVSDIATDTITAPAHGLANDTIVRAFPLGDGSLPAPLALDTRYFVANTATDTFKLSTTAGGGAIVNLTALGFFEVGLDKSLLVTSGGTASFAVGQLTVDEI